MVTYQIFYQILNCLPVYAVRGGHLVCCIRTGACGLYSVLDSRVVDAQRDDRANRLGTRAGGPIDGEPRRPSLADGFSRQGRIQDAASGSEVSSRSSSWTQDVRYTFYMG